MGQSWTALKLVLENLAYVHRHLDLLILNPWTGQKCALAMQL